MEEYITIIILKRVIITLYSIESSLSTNCRIKMGTPITPIINKYLVEKARNLK
jgi:hypothetical protein